MKTHIPRLISITTRHGDVLIAADRPAPLLRDTLSQRRWIAQRPMASRPERPKLPQRPLADFDDLAPSRAIAVAIIAVTATLLVALLAIALAGWLA